MVAFVTRMPTGIPGDLTRQSQATVETGIFDSNAAFGAYGLFGKLSSGKFVPCGASDNGSSVYGLLVRPFPTQGANASDPLGTSVPKTTGLANILKRGYANVKVNAGTAAAGGKVYVRTANASGGKVVGGIEAAREWGSSSAAKSGGNTGNGALTLDATTPVKSNGKGGVYTVRFIAAATNNGTFRVTDPDGLVLGDVVMSGGAGTFDGAIKFAVADGATDFVVGDGFDITVVENTFPVPGAYFMDAADASGNAEIAYNI